MKAVLLLVLCISASWAITLREHTVEVVTNHNNDQIETYPEDTLVGAYEDV